MAATYRGSCCDYLQIVTVAPRDHPDGAENHQDRMILPTLFARHGEFLRLFPLPSRNNREGKHLSQVGPETKPLQLAPPRQPLNHSNLERYHVLPAHMLKKIILCYCFTEFFLEDYASISLKSKNKLEAKPMKGFCSATLAVSA